MKFTTIKAFLLALIAKIQEIGCVDTNLELVILLIVTVILSVLPGPNIIIPIIYGRVKKVILMIIEKLKRRAQA